LKGEVEGVERFSGMFERAAEVLRRNDMGGWTRAASELYPHQWSWDSAFIAIGLAHLDIQRAGRELSTLFANQWANGKIPHIVFNPNAPPGSYLLGPEHWMPATLEKLDPGSPRRLTSALCQPAVHAVAALKIWEAAEEAGEAAIDAARAILLDLYPKLYAWHRYLLTKRDPERSGLVTVYHPWESGTDNSPRWDEALLAVEVGEMLPYDRPDLRFVDEPSERPTKEEYDRYLWLVELLKRSFYDEAEIYHSHPFLVKDVLFSAILVCANEALLKVAGLIGAPDEDRACIEDWTSRGRQGLKGCWDAELGLCLDYDLRAGRALRVCTMAGFAPLVAGAYEPWQLDALLEALYSPYFLGCAGLRWPLPPSTSPREARFHPRAYWRGPIWPIISWLFWRALRGAGEKERAANLRSAALEQLAAGGFAEYFEPFTGEPLGSDDQSWTAAVALDWVAEGDR
jgi:glucosylglycerate hydrolase